MSPSAIAQESTAELTKAGVKHIIAKTAPSLTNVTNGNGTHIAELDSSKIIFTKNMNPKTVPLPNSPEVWSMSTCTDHMLTCQWTSKTGWQTPEVRPYGPLSIMPTASVLHYATECFEGMKLYRGFDGRLRLFRPDCNARRMLISATRIALPAFDPIELENLIIKFCSIDGEKWLPKSRPGTFLYLRPTMIANGQALGVQKPTEALLYILACCFPSFDKPTGTNEVLAGVKNGATNGHAVPSRRPGLHLLASADNMVRAWPGGFGYAKVGANYGPSLVAQAEARARGYDQVLWLFGKDCEVTEAGASNFFVVWRTREGKTELVTAPLDGKIILDGVTRRSVLALARERLGREVECVERTFTMIEIVEALEEGRLIEAFAAGTAFFIAPISVIHFKGKDMDIPLEEETTGKYAAILKKWLKDIMYGNEQHPWGVVVEEIGA